MSERWFHNFVKYVKTPQQAIEPYNSMRGLAGLNAIIGTENEVRVFERRVAFITKRFPEVKQLAAEHNQEFNLELKRLKDERDLKKNI